MTLRFLIPSCTHYTNRTSPIPKILIGVGSDTGGSLILFRPLLGSWLPSHISSTIIIRMDGCYQGYEGVPYTLGWKSVILLLDKLPIKANKLCLLELNNIFEHGEGQHLSSNITQPMIMRLRSENSAIFLWG